MASDSFDVPKWAGKAPAGMHLDVSKDDKMLQKLMLDEKKCYLFGRNPHLNDVCIDHSSCSRIHAALVYHQHLQRFFLIDLASTHGTFVGSLRLEGNKPTQLPVDCTFHFGASTRRYTLRQRPISTKATRISADGGESAEQDIILPESELELDNLTEYNTANNKRVSIVGISEKQAAKKRKLLSVSFREEEDVINPEDIDPSVGKFRNLLQTAVIPNKKTRMSDQSRGVTRDYHILRPEHSDSDSLSSAGVLNPLLSATLGIQLPNPAPRVSDEDPDPALHSPEPDGESSELSAERKKKYAKESWPGRKPALF